MWAPFLLGPLFAHTASRLNPSCLKMQRDMPTSQAYRRLKGINIVSAIVSVFLDISELRPLAQFNAARADNSRFADEMEVLPTRTKISPQTASN